MANLILITGNPGTGKTTLVSRLFQLLSKHVSVTGFITEEVRPTQTSGRRSSRIGFDVVLLSKLDERRATLARCAGHETTALPAHAPRVGQYVVQLSSFESLALPCLQTTLNSLSDRNASGPSVCIIDEIGKMELCSPSFCAKIEKLIDLISTVSKQSSRAVLVATVPSARRPDGRRGIPLVDSLCSRPNVCLFEVTFSNRDDILQKVYQAVMDRLLL